MNDQLILEWLPWAHRTARYMARRAPAGILKDDLIGVAEESLVRAAAVYDPSRGAAFGTFAWPRVRGALLRACQRRTYRDRAQSRCQPLGEHPAEDPEHEVWSHKYLERLLPQHRAVVVAIYWSGMSQSELAEKMGCSREWVRRLHGEALEELRRRMR